MKSIYLGLALHNHQPVGNFPWVFEEVYRRAYLPMVEALERHPRVRLSLHYSGPLLDWLRSNQPELIARIGRLAAAGQVEPMGGGYYEPILPAVPDADKLGQIAMMRGALRADFGCDPAGLWLAERVWEPHLAAPLAQAGVKWTLVDDTHFRLVGLQEEDLFGYYITEEQGLTVKVFGTSKALRYLIPWHSVEEVIAYLRGQATEAGTRIAVMGDDGEKFGSWPGTYGHCWEEGWVDRLFEAFETNADWLKTIPLGEYAAAFPPSGRVYLPCASYDEMMEWALPAERGRDFVRLRQELERQGRADLLSRLSGGFWRYFMVRYPEINTMHKKMLRVHEKVYRARQRSTADCGLDHLWQAQCNCPYWHGVFGGIYMTDIRATTFSHLVQAENEADAVLCPDGRDGRPVVEMTDFDCDGREEVLVESGALSLYLDPARGGTLFEWDLRRRGYNLATVLARRPEAYHDALLGKRHADADDVKAETIHSGIRLKEKGLRRHLHYDRHCRPCLMEHFLGEKETLERFMRGTYRDLGDFAAMPYECSVQSRGDAVSILLQRHGTLKAGRTPLPLLVAKEMSILPGSESFHVLYNITNTGDKRLSSVLVSEWNINLLGGGHNDQAYCDVPGAPLQDSHFDSSSETAEVREVRLGNTRLGIALRLDFSRPVRLWRFSVESINNSEGGLERVHQGGCLAALLPFSLVPGETLELGLTWAGGGSL